MQTPWLCMPCNSLKPSLTTGWHTGTCMTQLMTCFLGTLCDSSSVLWASTYQHQRAHAAFNMPRMHAAATMPAPRPAHVAGVQCKTTQLLTHVVRWAVWQIRIRQVHELQRSAYHRSKLNPHMPLTTHRRGAAELGGSRSVVPAAYLVHMPANHDSRKTLPTLRCMRQLLGRQWTELTTPSEKLGCPRT
jgi:hypothetical protein